MAICNLVGSIAFYPCAKQWQCKGSKALEILNFTPILSTCGAFSG